MLGESSCYHCCTAGKREAYKGGMGLLQRAKGKVWAKIHYKLSSALGIPVPLYSICGFECYTENVFTTKLLKELIEIIKKKCGLIVKREVSHYDMLQVIWQRSRQ